MSVPFATVPQNSLPSGWTEHVAPGGQLYYFHAQSNQSTYIRPTLGQTSHPAKKKEKPSVKTAIPGTEWIRVKTTEGNVFYSHKAKKTSVWTVPDEIKDAVQTFEREEQEMIEKARQQQENESMAEVERIKAEVQELVKRKADEPAAEGSSNKRARIEPAEEEDSESDDEEEEEWQKKAAAQLAAEAEIEEKRRKKAEVAQKIQEEKEAKLMKESKLNMPNRVDLSLDEAKALFKTLLHEKGINPLHPWDKCLPQFVSDPRYVLLPSVSVRREVFDEYCRERSREIRASTVKEQKPVDPLEEYNRLLNEEVKSTRASWSEFKRTWKKDRRFYGWGRDDREREKKFKEFLKELGERKRAAAQKAEKDFFTLLKEHGPWSLDSVWKEVKKDISKDSRYEAVGSSSLREELFTTFLKAIDKPFDKKTEQRFQLHPTKTNESREERRERAVREREDKIRVEKERVEASIGRSRQELNREEDEVIFKTMLVDAIREPQATWDKSVAQLDNDPRFRNSSLPLNQQLHLFHEHVGHLRAKHIHDLYVLFESYAPSLATKFDEISASSLEKVLPVVKLGYDARTLQTEFEKWQRERSQSARTAFDTMLNENSFVSFWGQLRKIGGEGVEGGVKADNDDLPEDEGEGFGGRVDMKQLAGSVDVGEMAKVLKSDKRYMVFDHIPEQREQWLRDYVSQLSAPKLSVHLPPS